MPVVIVTDVRYRTAMAVIRPLRKAGFTVVAVQAAQESPKKPPAFSSRFVDRRVMLDGSVKDESYASRLLALCREYERPVLFPIGADTLAMLSQHAAEFEAVCDFLVSPPEILDAANDKRVVAETARSVGVPVPEEFDCADGKLPPRYPVFLKPRCGEKLGLHAEQRYASAENEEAFIEAYKKMSAYDPSPVVQERVAGDGCGICLVMDRNHRPVCVMGHKRIREYPISGGPSACCVSFYDETLERYAVRLLQALGFTGVAMVEFKGGKVLEINPRIWGSFPLTEVCGSRFAEGYVRAARSEETPAEPDRAFRRGRRMRFVLNDTLAWLSCLKARRWKDVGSGVLDVFRAKEALFRFTDQKPFWRYLYLTVRGKGGGV
ncbi:MAG: ATP-grasp domain-containing protein [Oscillospiraceae bacterium]|nr:ATP-grasp domain-containing protein [Oscillospiraceae bacterium]